MAKFDFKQFAVDDYGCGMKIGTDGVLLGSWAAIGQARTIVDLGAGSGLLALMCAQRNADAMICAIEIDPAAAEAATGNFRRSPWSNRLVGICCDANQVKLRNIDLIICNPPYFNTALKSPDAKRAKARHADALGPVSALEYAADWLAPAGSIAMITPAEIESELTYQAEMLRLKPWRLCHVSTVGGHAPTRLLSQWRFADGPIENSRLSIRDEQNQYTLGYRQLTQSFYLNF